MDTSSKFNSTKNTRISKAIVIAGILAIAIIGISIFTSCSGIKRNAPTQELNKYVNVFAGNASVGHTAPCATVPSGMIKVGPESGNKD